MSVRSGSGAFLLPKDRPAGRAGKSITQIISYWKSPNLLVSHHAPTVRNRHTWPSRQTSPVGSALISAQIADSGFSDRVIPAISMYTLHSRMRMKQKNKKKNVLKVYPIRSKFLQPRKIRSKKLKRLKNRGTKKSKIAANKQSVTVEDQGAVSPLVEKQLVTVEDEGVSPLVKKYWYQRYNLFSLYDHGIKLDEEGWFSVTPEEIAINHAQRTSGGTVIDCFTGVGGNAIQFAKRAYHVVAIDIDPRKIELAVNNARIYGVEDCIDFVVGDFFQLASSLKGDVAFLSPPWGGPTYRSVGNFTLDLLKPKDGYTIFQEAQKITPNIIMFLPRNVDLNQVEELSWLSSPPLNVEVEENYVQCRLKGVTAYFGNIAAVPAIES